MSGFQYGIPDALADSKYYVRFNRTWAEGLPRESPLILRKAEIVADSPPSEDQLRVSVFSPTPGRSANFVFYRSRGTSAAPDYPLAGDRLCFFSYGSYSGQIRAYFAIDSRATQNFSNAAMPSELIFGKVGSTGTSRQTFLTVGEDNAMTFATPSIFNSPIRYGQYTLTTLPSAAAFTNYLIEVTNATGGSKTCKSNGTNWLINNTSTVVF